ncbi:MAG: hypothetical protein LBG13_03710 [Holosporales bacterium]|nr:hypothetical protein [Holosporales bacterium]
MEEEVEGIPREGIIASTAVSEVEIFKLKRAMYTLGQQVALERRSRQDACICALHRAVSLG